MSRLRIELTNRMRVSRKLRQELALECDSAYLYREDSKTWVTIGHYDDIDALFSFLRKQEITFK